jgi:hypothetical protein
MKMTSSVPDGVGEGEDQWTFFQRCEKAAHSFELHTLSREDLENYIMLMREEHGAWVKHAKEKGWLDE